MNAALKGDPVVPFSGPDSFYEIGIKTKVPDVTGDDPADAEHDAEPGRLQPARSRPRPCTAPRRRARSRAPRHRPGPRRRSARTVKIYISDGRAPSRQKSPSPPPTSPPPARRRRRHPPSTSPPADPDEPRRHTRPRHHHHHHRQHRVAADAVRRLSRRAGGVPRPRPDHPRRGRRPAAARPS